MLHLSFPSASRRLKVALLIALVVLTTAMAASPRSVTLACEGSGGSCSCPGC